VDAWRAPKRIFHAPSGLMETSDTIGQRTSDHGW
jgi:hypothetical protein